jgi:hypothetical protein
MHTTVPQHEKVCALWTDMFCHTKSMANVDLLFAEIT